MSRQNLRESARTPPEARGLLSGTIKRGPLSKNRKNRLDLVNIEAKRQPPANPHLIRGPAGPPGPPRTISGLTRNGLGLERNHEASDEVPVFRLARGPAPQGLGRGTDSLTHPRPRATRPQVRYRFSDSPEAPRHEASDEHPVTDSLEAGSASTPSPPPWPTSLTGHHIQLTRSTTPMTSATRWHGTAE